MNRAFADVVIGNHLPSLAVIQSLNGQTVETPAESPLNQAQRFLENSGEPLPPHGAIMLYAARDN